MKRMSLARDAGSRPCSHRSARWPTDHLAADPSRGWSVVNSCHSSTSNGTAADLRFSGDCGPRMIIGDEEIACTFPPPAFQCPEFEFRATANATCTVHIDIFAGPQACASLEAANYVLTVEADDAPVDLTLIRDDSVP